MKAASHPDPQVPKSWPNPPADQHEAICRRAEEIYIRNGKMPGHDMENWVQAEKEILRESVGQLTRRKAVVVKVNGVQYIGEYDPDSSGGYTPGEFGAGKFVPVRFAGDKMFVKRPNGKELETRIVKKTG